MSSGTVTENIFSTLFVVILFLFNFLICDNGLIRWTLQLDVACNCGKKMFRKVYREKKPNLYQRFFFLPFRKKTKKWHYIIFLINIVTAPFVLLDLVAYDWLGPQLWPMHFSRIIWSIHIGTTIIGGVLPYYRVKSKWFKMPILKKKKRKDWEW